MYTCTKKELELFLLKWICKLSKKIMMINSPRIAKEETSNSAWLSTKLKEEMINCLETDYQAAYHISASNN